MTYPSSFVTPGPPMRLTQTKVSQTTLVPKMRIESGPDLDQEVKTLRLRLEAYVLTEHLATLTQEVVADHHATWWDHWKDAHPRWARRLRLAPVRYTRITQRVTFTREALYPQAAIAVPEMGRHVMFERMTRA